MEINHFSHEHPLVLSEEKFHKYFPCGVCCEPIFGVCYSCLVCQYVIHKGCADLPHELSSHELNPDHTLVLRPSPTSYTPCGDCGADVSGYGYGCASCSTDEYPFNLHFYCALSSDEYASSNMRLFIKDFDTVVTCHLCRNEEQSSSCLTKGFDEEEHREHYHWQCAMLPQVVKHDKHPHDLSLRPPLDEKDKCDCDVCREETNPDDWVYYCEFCNAVAHIGCGLSGSDRPVQDVLGNFPAYESYLLEEAKKIKEEADLHFVPVLHCFNEHPLVLIKYTRTIREVCKRCGLRISGLTYSCEECKFYFHESCKELPKEIYHPRHNDHGSLSGVICDGVSRDSSKCLQCGFVLDTCSEIKHFTHEHPLVLSEEKFHKDMLCGVCCESIFGVAYCCLVCPYVLHKWCADLPSEWSSHTSHPDHHLILRPTSMWSVERNECERCMYKILGYEYSCTDGCYFNLHVYCASFPEPSIIELLGSKLTIRLSVVGKNYGKVRSCPICPNEVHGVFLHYHDGEDYVYCHIQCVMLPRMVKHDRHLHNLHFRPPLVEHERYFEFICDVCEEERNPDDWVYYCESCEVIAHIGCGITGLDRPVQDVLGNSPVYKSLQLGEAANIQKVQDDLSLPKYQFGSKEEAEKIEEDDLQSVHVVCCFNEHPLVLVGYTKTIREVCAVCSLHISGRTYSCEECNFYIHKRCTELPKEIYHPDGSFQLVSRDGCSFFECFGYDLPAHTCFFPLINIFCHPSNEYALTPVVVQHSLDFLVEYDSPDDGDSPPYFEAPDVQDFNLNHPSHEHPLTPVVVKHSPDEDEEYFRTRVRRNPPVSRRIIPLCQACGLLCEDLTLKCLSCKIYLHVFCSLLPLTGKHTRHRHELSLTYSYKEDPKALEFFCDTCEKPRIPNRWVYYCPDPRCTIVSHIECVDPDIFNARGAFDINYLKND